MTDVPDGRRPRDGAGRWAGLIGRGRSAREPDRGTVDEVAEDQTTEDQTAEDGADRVAEQDETEDVRDDETTRASGAAGAEDPALDTTVVEELLTRLATAERAREQAELARDEAVHRADTLAAALEEARARPAETFGMRADKVLRMADHDAAQRRRAAEREAEELREQARADAEWITTEARGQASRITADAHTRAQRVAADAAAEVDRLNAAGVAARRDGELVADTAASMHAHASGLRSTVRDEVARLHALLGAELHRLDGPAPLTGRGGQGGRGEDTGPLPVVDPRTGPAGAAPATDEPAARPVEHGSGPGTGDLPAVSLPEQRAGAGTDPDADSGNSGEPDTGPGRAAEPVRTSGHTGDG